MIGRVREQELLMQLADSDESEFVAVYGRRRIGKTYLIRETFEGEFAFHHAGVAQAGMRQQLQAFRNSLREFGHAKCPRLTNWLDAFEELKEVVRKSGAEKKILFIDEMPWMDTAKSGFVYALEHFWNGWASMRRDVLLIICGSATSWIINKVIKDKGGLHNRVTEQIALEPFTLRECELYAAERGLGLTRRQIAECYMVFGGVPFYWRMLRKGMSPAQDMDELFFASRGRLRGEFDELYASLFRNSEPYVKIVCALGSRSAGLTRDEIADAAGIENCGRFSHQLEELEQCGFIRRYHAIGMKTKGALYQLIDNYTLFYFKFVKENVGHDVRFWSSSLDTPVRHAWEGLAFERLCLQHVDQIKRALQIAGIASSEYSWRGIDPETRKGTQIDLLIDRSDGVLDLCEMKWTKDPFVMNEQEWSKIQARQRALKMAGVSSKAVHVILVSAAGLSRGAWANEVQNLVTLDDLFC